MIWQRVSFTLLASSILALAAVVASPVRAEDKPAPEKKEVIPAPAAAPATPAVVSSVVPGGCGAPATTGCGPTYTTVKVTEYQSTTVKEKRIVMKPITTNETYTAYKTECVEEAQTRTFTVNKSVCVTTNETRTISKCVPTMETRTVTKCVPVCKTVTEMCTKTVDKGHWECKEECVAPSFFAKAKHKLFSHKDACGCECETSCCEPAPVMKTRKVWVACPTTESYPVTKTVRSFETVTSTVQVCVNKTVCETVVVPVTSWKCVPECKTEVVKVMVKKCVPYTATRCVTKCVPVEEEVMVTKCVPVIVEKQVACAAPSCGTPCGTTCGGCDECTSAYHHHKSMDFGAFFAKFHKKSCDTCATPTCSSCGCK